MAVEIILTGAIDGTNGTDGNPSFTLTESPLSSAAFFLFRNGVLQADGTHYTRADTAISFLAPYIPVSGDILSAYGDTSAVPTTPVATISAALVRLTPRKIYKDDLRLATTPNPATVNELVMGAGRQDLTPCDFLVLSNLTQATGDAGAAAAGVPVGALYWNTTTSRVHAREV